MDKRNPLQKDVVRVYVIVGEKRVNVKMNLPFPFHSGVNRAKIASKKQLICRLLLLAWENKLEDQPPSVYQLLIYLGDDLVGVMKVVPVEPKNWDPGLHIDEPFFVTSLECFEILKIDTVFAGSCPFPDTFEGDFGAGIEINDQIGSMKEVGHVQIE